MVAFAFSGWGENLHRDCRGICTPKKWLHDKVCHENFNCLELGYDGGDCLTSSTGSAPAAETAKFHIETYQVSDMYKTAIYVQANEPFSGFSFRLVDEQGSANTFSISKVCDPGANLPIGVAQHRECKCLSE